MKLIHLIFKLLILAALIGCESDLNLKLEESGGNLVLFSFLKPDSTFKVHLSRSVSHSSMNDYDRVYDGYVVVKKNGEVADSFNWNYRQLWAERPLIKINAGDHFEVIGGNKTSRAIGETNIPEPIKIETVTLNGLDELPTRDNISCIITFIDPPKHDNYYRLIISEKTSTKTTTGYTLNERNVRYLKDDQVFYIRDQEGSLLGGIDFDGAFSDYLIAQIPYKLKVRIPKSYFREPKENEKRELIFQLQTLSKEYYDYLRSRIIAEYNQKLPVVSPIKIHNNVNGGLGLIGGFSADTYSFDFIGTDYE